jgi:exopolysaccharide/PEP-CTERM locus tyrosine autokinase
MGKFFEALKKSEKSRDSLSSKTHSRKVFELSGAQVHAMRLDSQPVVDSKTNEQEFNGRIDPRLVSLLTPQSPIAEQFKLLRAKILSRYMARGPLTIMVTSSQPLDGKSTIASNLAVTIAQGVNEHVLLVDCDLRRPRLHQVFGLKPKQGLREYLEEGTSVAPYLLKTAIRKLTLLPAGKPPLNPTELLSSEKMGRLVEELKGRYEDRHVIFDTTPAGIGAETSFITNMVDGVLLVIRYGQSSMKHLTEAINLIGRERIMGVVFNASNESHQKYYKYYRYYQRGAKNV